MNRFVKSALLIFTGQLLPFVVSAQNIGLFYPRDIPQVEFAASEIRAAAQSKGITCAAFDLENFSQATQSVRVVLISSNAAAQSFGVSAASSLTNAESYFISTKIDGMHTNYFVVGADAVGAMYGGLDIAEAIKLGTLAELKIGKHAPFVERRGIKFNIPLDARTPSYSDAGDAAQQNIPEM